MLRFGNSAALLKQIENPFLFIKQAFIFLIIDKGVLYKKFANTARMPRECHGSSSIGL